VLEEKQFPTHIKPVIAGDDTTLARNQSRPGSHGSSRPNPPHQTKVNKKERAKSDLHVPSI